MIPDDAEKPLCFLPGEGTGRLVERDDLGVVEEGLADLDHLPLSDGEVFHFGVRMNVFHQLPDLNPGALPEGFSVQKDASAGPSSQEHVFRHGHFRDQIHSW
jgi:hypothetical protein